MNKLSGFFLIVITLVALSCEDEQVLSTKDLQGATYTGVIPCADCEGIAYRLSIKQGNRFETSSVYIGKSNRAFTERGNWSIQGDSLLVLNPSEETPRQFKFKNEQLVMLDSEGKEISGSLAKMYVLNESDSSVTDYRWEQRREQGIDFRAAGNEPSWSLDIDFDKMITFKTLNGDSITTPVPQMEKDTATKARIWNAETETGSLRVEVFPTGCVDDMSGEVFSHAARATYNGSTYSGCGNFINNSYMLNDFWQLQTMNGNEITAQNIPSLQFDVAAQKVFGSTGCNRLNGSAEIEDKDLSFSKMASTRRACPGDLESRFLDAMQKVDKYAIANAELLLMNESDTLMVFRRAG